MNQKAQLIEKFKEAAASVLPIVIIVGMMCLTFIPMQADLMLSFLIGSLMLIVGMGLFTLGSEVSMTPIGTHMGARLTKSRNLTLILIVSFLLGIAVTVSEPDLTVLAENVPAIDTMVLIITVGVGVGIFLMLSMVRILFKIPLKWLLIGLYGFAFLLAALASPDYWAVAFDSGGVTTGPITVPFIMALGVGISAVLGDPRSKDNSFGLVSLCSVGPIVAVLLLSIFSDGNLTYEVPDYTVSADIVGSFLHTAVHTCKEVAVALGLIVAFFMICQFTFLKLSVKRLQRIAVGVALTFAGLVIFLTGVNVGFMPIGYKLGHTLAQGSSSFLIGFGLVTGVLVVLAEPAIHVLNQQVEDVTGGIVTKKSMILGLCIGVGAAIALSMVRIVYDFSLVYYIIPGYFISLALSLFVPPVYTAIAFDSGGVASGPMTSGFILPFAVGATVALQGADAVLRDAFGVVALVAMAPLITIQLLGFRGIIADRMAERKAMKRILDADDQQIINFM